MTPFLIEAIKSCLFLSNPIYYYIAILSLSSNLQDIFNDEYTFHSIVRKSLDQFTTQIAKTVIIYLVKVFTRITHKLTKLNSSKYFVKLNKQIIKQKNYVEHRNGIVKDIIPRILQLIKIVHIIIKRRLTNMIRLSHVRQIDPFI